MNVSAKGFAPVLLLVIMAGLIVVGGFVFATSRKGPINLPSPSPDSASCEKEIQFTKFVIDPNLVRVVTPLGTVGGGGEIVGRSYIFPKDDLAGQKIPLYMPADATLQQGAYYKSQGLPNSYKPEYSLYFDLGCGKSLSFFHIKEVIDPIKMRFPSVQNASAGNSVEPLDLKAGDLFGYYIPGPNSIAWDFIVEDSNVTNKFANQERYEAGYGSNILHVACPYDLYSGEKKDEYYSLLGSAGGKIIPGVNCGTVSRDKLGSIEGQWFTNPDPESGMGEYKWNGPYHNPFPVVKEVDGNIDIYIGGTGIVRINPNNSSYLDPEKVTNEHCYLIQPTPSESVGYVYFKLISNTEMKVSYSETGTCPTTFPDTGSQTYYR